MRTLLIGLALCAATHSASAQVADSTAVGITRDSIGAFRKVEIEADYPGGIPAWKNFLYNNLNPDAVAKALPKKTKHFQQTARVQFIVCTDGTVCNVRVINDVHPAVRKEAERAIRESGVWVPAQQGGRKVKAYRTQPITFVITE
ncbi:energy transducer TonB [Flaviaesturariibacter amylovorans]|uniref:TonB C-terminal domain-containing protein n=1 Tax=Flaviaesturariibacter amylovorans TaxID=1084520 RepID=A0ABP8G7V8_9BACT